MKVDYQIYCDMDDVLVNFEDACTNLINADLRNADRVPREVYFLYAVMKRELMSKERLSITKSDFSRQADNRLESVRSYMYERVQNNLEFWCTLPWKYDGQELWNYIKNFNPKPIILTAPMDGENCIIGKKLWAKNHLDDSQIILNERKYEYSTPQSILIDDYINHVMQWRVKGGICIHHKNTNDTIKELKNILQY